MIVCVDDRYGISRNGKIPWYHREDLLFFREMARGKVCLFGRKTWESIADSGQRYLQTNSKVFVLSRSKPWESFLEFATMYPDLEIMICGGQDIYQLALERIPIFRIYMTRIPGDFQCDRWFCLPSHFVLEEETYRAGATFQVWSHKSL